MESFLLSSTSAKRRHKAMKTIDSGARAFLSSAAAFALRTSHVTQGSFSRRHSVSIVGDGYVGVGKDDAQRF